MFSNKIKNYIVLFFIAIIIVAGLFYADRTFAAGEITINSFDLNPKVIANNTIGTQLQMTFRVTVNLDKFNSRCGSNESSFYWYIYENVTGVDLKRSSGEQRFDRTSANVSVTFDQLVTVDTSDPKLTSGGSATYYGQVNCPSTLSVQIARSELPGVTITFGALTDKNYACVAGNNKYACSPVNLSNCSDASACAGRPCIEIGKNLCGQDTGTGPLPPPGGGGTCNNNGKCESPGETTFACPSDCKGGPGVTQTFIFKLENPLEADNFLELIDVLATWLFNLSIPIVVVMIVYSGVMFLTSRGDTTKITKARQILLYAVVGFAIILIGKGFITLIESILNLGAGP